MKTILGQMLPLIVRIDATMPHLATKAELHAAFGMLYGKMGALHGKIGDLRREVHSELGKLRAALTENRAGPTCGWCLVC